MMNKSFFVILALVCVNAFAYGDETCNQSIEEAKSKYNSGNYEKAKALFEFVASECGSDYGDVASWISKCQTALMPTLSISRTSLSFEESSSTASIRVTSNRKWRVQESGVSWISIAVNGNVLTVSCSRNSSVTSRSSYFDVMTSDGLRSVRVSISQSGVQNQLTKNSFFPIGGVTLGVTTWDDAKSLGYNVETTSSGSRNFTFSSGFYFWDHRQSGIFEHIYAVNHSTMPDHWTNIGMSWDMSWDRWITFFEERGFSIEVKKAPMTDVYHGRNVLKGELHAISYDRTIRFDLDFNYGNDNNEGYSTSAKKSLYSISVDVRGF